MSSSERTTKVRGRGRERVVLGVKLSLLLSLGCNFELVALRRRRLTTATPPTGPARELLIYLKSPS